MNIPFINKKFYCIVDRNNPQLAAIISSYLSEEGTYLSMFEFPTVTAPNDPNNDTIDENHLSRSRADEFIVFTINAIRRIGGDNNLILAGLSKEQKSYLDFLNEFNVIEISEVSEVDFCLSPFLVENRKKLLCRNDDILQGLYIAHNTKSVLGIDDNANPLSKSENKGEGLIVIENDKKTSSIIAINYAFSINASIDIVECLNNGEENNIRNLIKEWQDGDDNCLYEIKNKISQKVGHINFIDYKFVTFFSIGLPYSLLIENSIPCSYVHLLYRADFFIVNNLLFEHLPENGSAVIFSPEEFANEETTDLVTILESNNYYVRKLIGVDANVENIHNCIKYYPYDVFHICSHGGEIEGYEVTEVFTDRNGNNHEIVYDEVLGFAPGPEQGLITVHRKIFPREVDGYIWRSHELKAKNYPHHFFSDMFNSISLKNKRTEVQRKHKDVIKGSSSIKCRFSNYQAMFSVLADHRSPFIFNNTCWSANEILEPFLVGGARGYIGTLWKVENIVAVEVAKMFYNNLFWGTILDSFFKAQKIAKGTGSQNIYIYYGLHFSTLKAQGSKETSSLNILKNMLNQHMRWLEKLTERKGKSNEGLIKEILKWLKSEIFSKFSRSDFEKLRSKKKN